MLNEHLLDNLLNEQSVALFPAKSNPRYCSPLFPPSIINKEIHMSKGIP